MWTSFISNALWIRDTKYHHYLQKQGLLTTCKYFIKRVMYARQSSYLLQPSPINTKIIQNISLKNHILHTKYWGISLSNLLTYFTLSSECILNLQHMFCSRYHKGLSTANACKIFIFLSWQSRISSGFCFRLA